MNWYLKVLKKYAVFHGRARRKEYWYFYLFNFLIYFACVLIDRAAGFSELVPGRGPLAILYILAVLVPEIAVTARRLHDIGHSGWWQLMWIPFVPAYWLLGDTDSVWLLLVVVITLVVLLVFLLWMVRDSDPDENRWGPNPKKEPVPDRRSGKVRHKANRRHRAVLVEDDRRSGWDRRSGDRREK